MVEALQIVIFREASPIETFSPSKTLSSFRISEAANLDSSKTIGSKSFLPLDFAIFSIRSIEILILVYILKFLLLSGLFVKAI